MSSSSTVPSSSLSHYKLNTSSIQEEYGVNPIDSFHLEKEKGKKKTRTEKQKDTMDLVYEEDEEDKGKTKTTKKSQQQQQRVYEYMLEKMQIEIGYLDEERIEFEISGIDTSIANALRRIMLSEVPSMAVETVHIFENSSILHDETLAHRLGLIPIYANPNQFKEKKEGEDDTVSNTIVFNLDFEAVHPNMNGTTDTSVLDESKHKTASESLTIPVYSKSLKWFPLGNQADVFGAPPSVEESDDDEDEEDDEESTTPGQKKLSKFERRPLRPVHDKIIIAKLKPGQSIKLEAWCRKGIGKDHQKYSPVATASYRLLPEILVDPSVQDSKAQELVDMCPAKVFDIEDLESGHKGVKVSRPRHCTMCRECIRKDDWAEKVQLRRVANHFIFSVETVGARPPIDIVKEALGVLKSKCDRLLNYIENNEPL